MESFHPANLCSAIFFLDDLHNLATPTVQDTALIIRDQFQSFGIEGVNLSICFSARRDYFSGVRNFAEPAVRFYNKCALEPFTLEETNIRKPRLRARAWIHGSWRNGSSARRSVILTFLPSSAESLGGIIDVCSSPTCKRAMPSRSDPKPAATWWNYLASTLLVIARPTESLELNEHLGFGWSGFPRMAVRARSSRVPIDVG